MDQTTVQLLPSILVIMGLGSVVFTIWSWWSIRKHIEAFKSSFKFSSGLTDEKYFELKSKQEYIVAITTIIGAVIAFLGYQSISDFKTEFNKDLIAETTRLTKLHSGTEAAFGRLASLEKKIQAIYQKNIIQQNIFIVEKVNVNKLNVVNNIARIDFNTLTTISGEKLPRFKTPPSILIASRSYLWPLVSDITVNSFTINISSAVADEHGNISDIIIDIWISQKP
ncbi:hypothetical protein [Flavitalea sp.]|nr:hypothetical protein [Flavitalea sp.]